MFHSFLFREPSAFSGTWLSPYRACGKPLQFFRGGGVEPHMGRSPTARISYSSLIAPLSAPVSRITNHTLRIAESLYLSLPIRSELAGHCGINEQDLHNAES